MNIFYTDLMARQAQYKDLLRDAERYRLLKAIAQPRPKRLQKIVAVLRQAIVRLTRNSQKLSPAAASEALD